ncbi:MAG TPA: transglutaminase domain-containing protein, partial [Firmicutes bacterium]|nr:transglutaminase domain-containing protein [Bacillota bacterium]
MPKKTVRLFAIVIALTVVFISGCPKSRVRVPEPDSETSNAIPDFEPEPMKPSVKKIESIELNRNDLMRIGRTMGVELSEGMNEIYEVDGVSVQVNWLKPSDENDLIALFNGLFGQVGSINAVLAGLDRIFEIRNTEPYSCHLVKDSLELALVQELKLTPMEVFGEGEIIFDNIIIDNELTGVEERLGVDIATLINQGVEISGRTIRMNYILPEDVSSQREVIDTLARVKGTDFGIFTIDRTVIEVVTDRTEDVEHVHRLLTIPPVNSRGEAHFRVTFEVVPVVKIDYMKMNECTLAVINNADDERLREIDPGIKLGSSLQIFTNGGISEILSEPRGNLKLEDDSVGVYEIQRDRGARGLNPAEIIIETQTGVPLREKPENIELYIKSTERWPVLSRSITRELVGAFESVGDEASDRDKAVALHSWVHRGIRHGGPVVGSRYGTESVLGQGFGQCWDLSDVFITMARAAGLPARQVAGWIYGGEGHVWSQVWLEDEGIWLDIDTTLDSVGVSSYY